MGERSYLPTIAAAVAVHDAHFDPQVRLRRVVPHLDAVLTASGHANDAVRALERSWDGIVASAFEDADNYDRLVAALPEDDPVKSEGFLELINRPRKETLHTAALGRLLQPSTNAGRDRLHAFLTLALVQSGLAPPEPRELANAKVMVETSYELKRRSRMTYPTPDLRIEVGSLVVVVENKIDDSDREGQLSSYAEAARLHDAGADLVLIYLTPDGRAPSDGDAGEEWGRMSYRTLASAWRAVMAAHDRAGTPWAPAERSYLSTIVREVCIWRLGVGNSRSARCALVPYLRAATGEKQWLSSRFSGSSAWSAPA